LREKTQEVEVLGGCGAVRTRTGKSATNAVVQTGQKLLMRCGQRPQNFLSAPSLIQTPDKSCGPTDSLWRFVM